MSQAELRDAERLIDLLKPRLEERRTRRQELHDHGQTLAPRAMFRRNLATGGDFVTWIWRRRTTRPRPARGDLRHQRFHGAPVAAAAAVRPGDLAGSAVRAESFVFSTRLTRVTRILRDRDRDRALAKVSDAVSDWAGGTRIGESLRVFNQKWARRVAAVRRGRRDRVGRLGSRRSGGRGARDGPAPALLPPARLAESAGRRARAISRWPRGCRPRTRTSTTSCPPARVASLERLGVLLAGRRRPPGRPHRRPRGRCRERSNRPPVRAT